MRALAFDGQRVALEERERPEPAGETLVEVVLSGVCRTDLEIVRGYKGFRGVLGHEFVGRVGERRVVAEINVGCGACGWCRAHGDGRHCPERSVLGILGRDGAFAEWVRVPEGNLLDVPACVSDRQAVFAEPLAAALEVVPLLSASEPVLVVGDGRLGALLALALQASGFEVLLVGRHPGKLAALRDLGLACAEWPEAERRRWTQAVEASGSVDVPGHMLQLLEPRGRLVLKTTGVEKAQLDLSLLVVKEIQLLGSRCGRLGEALALMERGGLPLEGLISHVVPLSEGERAFGLDGFKTLIDNRR